MRTWTCIIVVLAVLFVVVTSSSSTDTIGLSDLYSVDLQVMPADAYIVHEPITILSDADFISQGWHGNGTKSNPYVIEGLEIESYYAGIHIENTASYFELRDCRTISESFYYYNPNYGIYLVNVTHGTIQDCTEDGKTRGIYLADSSICTITHNKATDCAWGVYIIGSENCTLTHNEAEKCDIAFSLDESQNCILTRNSASSCSIGYSVHHESTNCTVTHNTAINNKDTGLNLSSSRNCTVTDNRFSDKGIRVSGLPRNHWVHNITANFVNKTLIGYFFNVNGTTINGSLYGQLILGFCWNVTIRNGIFNNVTKGIDLVSCTNCTLWNITSKNCEYGIRLFNSVKCTLRKITSDCNIYGIYLNYAHNSILETNIAKNNRYGFSILGSDFCTLINNTATANLLDGFFLTLSQNCTLVGNTATDNGRFGISLVSFTMFCKLYLNKLGNNGESNGYDDGGSNMWDDGVSKGNYWIDYTGFGVYQIPGDEGSIDNYPFGWEQVIALRNLEVFLLLSSVGLVALVIIVERTIRKRTALL